MTPAAMITAEMGDEARREQQLFGEERQLLQARPRRERVIQVQNWWEPRQEGPHGGQGWGSRHQEL